MNTVVVEKCPLKEWHLKVQAKFDTTKYPDKDCWPTGGNIKIHVGELETFLGTTRFSYARIPSSGVSPVVVGLDGGDTQQDFWLKAEPENGGPWGSGAPLKVTVKPGEASLVVLELDPTGGAIEVTFSRGDGKPLVNQLDFKITGPDAKAGQLTVDGKKLISPIRPGDYVVAPTDPVKAVVQKVGEVWKLGPSADGSVKVPVKAGKISKVDLTLTTYTKAQFVAFNIKPGVKKDGSGKATGYLGAATNAEDMARRFLVMKSAMQKALAVTGVNKPEVLKIFMAPEFYWRGVDGAYPFEDVADIMELLRPEAQKAEYADWIFVFGTAIGYFKQGDHVESKPFPLAIKSVGEWDNSGVKLPLVNVIADSTLARKESASPKVCGRIPEGSAAPIRWQVKQNPLNAGVIKAVKVSDAEYQLFLDTAGAFAQGKFTLNESVATEVFNLALLQRGGPARGGGGLSEAIVYKEFISHIDFIGSPPSAPFHKADGSGRTVTLSGVKDRVVLPTRGSSDRLGGDVNKFDAPNFTELNRSGLGGGSLFRMDGINFGLEVCRDHCVSRLRNYVDGAMKPGEPMPQIA